MARFDFIDPAVRSYLLLMHKNEVIGRMAAIPLLVKLVSFTGITALGLEGQALREGLLMLPGYFAEGWLAAHIVRLAILEESDLGARGSPARHRGILSGMIFYVLLKLAVFLFYRGFSGAAENVPAPVTAGDPSLEIYIVSFMLLLGMIWVFRFFWIYIPAALDRPVGEFLRRVKTFRASAYMVGTWMLSFVPLAFLLVMISEAALGIFPLQDGKVTPGYSYLMAAAQAVLDILITIISSAALAYNVENYYKD